ncbi:hypothetical protein JCM14202_1221 [Agrilactobacillus composti DSM 18527 = JCM 14202]|uniref:hypothetical protein n=1 Tax=Agrilactobacillus composti TaxID=398555 RepID=UPI00042E0BF0|nr:hypothetical protein [Agrilactobacillus composti]GAF39362.1 hypothetical protein JCM14202_1221 [Agrilactobacillus composti DSM 18527 = JCM 14202]
MFKNYDYAANYDVYDNFMSQALVLKYNDLHEKLDLAKGWFDAQKYFFRNSIYPGDMAGDYLYLLSGAVHLA